MTPTRGEHRRRLKSVLSDSGQRLTRQRARVFEVLAATDQHPTAEEVYRKVKQALPAVSLATVYKSLDTLVRCRLAQKLTNGDGSARYDANVAEHPHMRDLLTGRVLDVPHDLAGAVNFALERQASSQIEHRTGFKVTGLRVELVGFQARGGSGSHPKSSDA